MPVNMGKAGIQLGFLHGTESLAQLPAPYLKGDGILHLFLSVHDQGTQPQQEYKAKIIHAVKMQKKPR